MKDEERTGSDPNPATRPLSREEAARSLPPQTSDLTASPATLRRHALATAQHALDLDAELARIRAAYEVRRY